MVAAAIVGSAVVGVAGTSIASSNAAGAQSKAAQNATNTEQAMYNQTRSDLAPYNQQGLQAYGTLNQLLGVGGSGNSSQMQDTLNNLPGYQFTLNQGLKSTQNSYAARGLADSGGALKGAANYATGLANSQYGNYVNQLQASAGLGENAAAQTGNYGTQTAAQIGSNQIGAGNASAAASNAIGNSVTNGATSLSQYYTLNSLLNNTNTANSNNPSDFFNTSNSNYENG